MGQLLSLRENLPPPSAHDSEVSVLGNCLNSPHLFEQALSELRVDHFFDDAHKQVWLCYLEAHREGVELHPVDLKSRLERKHRLEQVGGSPFIGELMYAPVEADLSTHIRLIRDAWRKREIGSLAGRIAVESKNGVGDVQRWASEQSAALALLAEADKPKVDPWGQRLDVTSLFTEELPPIRWAVPGLEIGPGRPCAVWGKPGSGKTLFVQEIALAVATGGVAFGQWECPRGRVLHLSYDFGAMAVKIRYRQLANGLGLTAEEIAGYLEARVFPAVYLNTPNAERMFLDACQGFDLVVVDCLRDALPGEEENDSQVAIFLKMLARVSEQLGCSFLYLHHLKKGDEDITIDSGRGSGSIGGASGTIWSLEGQGNDPRTAKHIRQHDVSGGVIKPFQVEKVAADGGSFATPYPAIRLMARSAEASDVETAMAQVERNKGTRAANVKLLVRILAANPNCTKKDLEGHTRGTPLASRHKDGPLARAIDEALEDGLIDIREATGRGGTKQIYNVTRKGTATLTLNWSPDDDL